MSQPLPPKIDKDVAGLSQKEAGRRLLTDGLNELPSQNRKSLIQSILDVFKDPMLLILLIGGLIYTILGDLNDAAILMVAVLGVITITLVQERKTEKALEALRNMANPKALVIRDGKVTKIPGSQVVRGDLVILETGDRVTADGELIEQTDLEADESLLTGESLAIKKSLKDGANLVYMGTLITRGKGIMRVKLTGSRTKMGQIGLSLKTIREDDTHLQRETKYFVKIFAMIGLGLCLLMVTVYGLHQGDWWQGALNGITLMMALLPEEFSVILVVFLTMGAWRLSKNKVLTRNMAAIETLGATTVLAVDKTGTLTQNSMSLNLLATPEGQRRLKDDILEFTPSETKLLRCAFYACQPKSGDPLDNELIKRIPTLIQAAGKEEMTLLKEYPVTEDHLCQIQVWQKKDGNIKAYTKGAPETIFKMTGVAVNDHDPIWNQLKTLSEEGLRILAVASKELEPGATGEQIERKDFSYRGFIGFKDPIRASVKPALIEAYQAGMKVMMITGDYPGTARAIATEIGLRGTEKVITGEEINQWEEAELARKLTDTAVCSRVMPEQKLKIVEALKRNGEVVAMTGDGINDAPALKAASIGIAMGNKGTDVAREAADMVLLEDDFQSLVKAVRMGRRIYTNIQKAMTYTLAVHVPIAGMALIPVLLDKPLILFPTQIALLELLIDPACSVVFEAQEGEGDLMKRPPRPRRERMFSVRLLAGSILQGLIGLLIILTVYRWALISGYEETVVRSITFLTLVLTNIAMILANLTQKEPIWWLLHHRNKQLIIILSGVGLLLTIIMSIGVIRELFRFGALEYWHGGLLLMAMAGSYLLFELVEKWVGSCEPSE